MTGKGVDREVDVTKTHVDLGEKDHVVDGGRGKGNIGGMGRYFDKLHLVSIEEEEQVGRSFFALDKLEAKWRLDPHLEEGSCFQDPFKFGVTH